MINCRKVKGLLNDYLMSEFVVEQKRYGCHVVTPFLDHINDSLSFHIFDKGKGKIQLTDIGHTLDRLDDLGINYKDGATFDKVMMIAERLGLIVNDEWNIIRNSDVQNLSHDICKFITGIQEIGSFYLMVKTRKKYDFEKKINTFFVENRIKPIRRKVVSGKHERTYKTSGFL